MTREAAWIHAQKFRTHAHTGAQQRTAEYCFTTTHNDTRTHTPTEEKTHASYTQLTHTGAHTTCAKMFFSANLHERSYFIRFSCCFFTFSYCSALTTVCEGFFEPLSTLLSCWHWAQNGTRTHKFNVLASRHGTSAGNSKQDLFLYSDAEKRFGSLQRSALRTFRQSYTLPQHHTQTRTPSLAFLSVRFGESGRLGESENPFVPMTPKPEKRIVSM